MTTVSPIHIEESEELYKISTLFQSNPLISAYWSSSNSSMMDLLKTQHEHSLATDMKRQQQTGLKIYTFDVSKY